MPRRPNRSDRNLNNETHENIEEDSLDEVLKEAEAEVEGDEPTNNEPPKALTNEENPTASLPPVYREVKIEPVFTNVDINLLKKKKSLERMEAAKMEAIRRKKQIKQVQPKKMAFRSAESIIRSHRQKEAQRVRTQKVEQSQQRLLDKHPEPKLLMILRIRGFYGVTNKIRKILLLLKLRTIRSAVFVRATPKIMYLLKVVEHFVTYGYPTLKTVRDFITKRGYCIINNKKTPLNDNKIIEEHFGEYNIVCVEDLVNEIWTGGENYKKVFKFLCPFSVNPPPGGYTNKRIPFQNGGDAGFRGLEINKLFEKSNY